MITVRPMTEDDLERVLELKMLGFGIESGQRDRTRTDIVPAEYRVAERDGHVVACLRILRFGHFFGGREVPAAGIASVAVAAEARGLGVGTALMGDVLSELRAEGLPVSSLYPATAVLYKRSGYGFGGVRSVWRVTLDSLPNAAGPPVEPFDESAIEEVDACYRRIARATNGLVVRDRAHWENRVLRSPWSDAPQYRFLVREGGDVAGWIVYTPERRKDSWRFTMECRDLMWSTPTAGRALLSLAALHRSTAQALEWVGPPDEPLATLLPEEIIEGEHRFRYMVRLLDVPAAFEARGFNPVVQTRVSIAVRDAAFPANEGPWMIEVSEGRAKVVPAESADATVDAGMLASIWTGLTGARDAARTGAFTGSAEAMDALDAMFAGPAPWIADFF